MTAISQAMAITCRGQNGFTGSCSSLLRASDGSQVIVATDNYDLLKAETKAAMDAGQFHTTLACTMNIRFKHLQPLLSPGLPHKHSAVSFMYGVTNSCSHHFLTAIDFPALGLVVVSAHHT